MALYKFTDTEQYALRLGGWRVTPEQADMAVAGSTATVKATGRWSIVYNGEQIAIGAGENPILSAIDAIAKAEQLRARRILARIG